MKYVFKLLVIMLSCSLWFTCNAFAAIHEFMGLTGAIAPGQFQLDGIVTNNIRTRDYAIGRDASGNLRVYKYDEDNTTAEDSDIYIYPNWIDEIGGTAYTGTGSWVLQSFSFVDLSGETVDLTDITDGNIPYMQAAGAGFGDSPLSRTDADTITLQATTGNAVTLNLYSDAAEDNSDKWRVQVADGGDVTLETYQSGAWVAVGTLTNAGAYTVIGALAGATYGSDASISDAELLTLDDGELTELLVGGGAGSAPVWTTATGTGAPVRAGSPALTGSPTVETSIDPDTADGAAIGSATKEWSDLYLAASGVIYGENDQSNTLTSSASGWVANLGFSAASLTTTATSAPAIDFFDDDCDDDDINARVYANATTTGTGAEVVDMYFQAQGAVAAGALGTFMFWDGSAKGLGISTTAPSNQFEVTKTAIGATPVDTNGIRISNTTDAAAGAQQYSPPLVFRGSGWKTDATAASQKVEFMQDVRPVQGTSAPTGYWGVYPSINDAAYSATPAIAVTSAGNVGIGTAGPATKLDVNGSLIVRGDGTSYGYITSDSTYGLSFRWNATSGAGIGFASSALIPTSDGGFSLGGLTSRWLDLYLKGNGYIAGNVGIGTTSPATKLDQAQFSADALGSYHTFSKSRHATAGSHTIVQDNDVIGGVNFAPSDGTDFGTVSAQIKAEVDDAAPAASSIGGALVFSTAAGAGADDLTERMRIDKGGKVTINGMVTYNTETITCVGDAGTASVGVRTSWIVTDGGADTNEDTVSLAAGVVGDEKVFVYLTETDVGDTANVTPAGGGLGWTKIVFDIPGEGCVMTYTSGGWAIVSNNGGVIS